MRVSRCICEGLSSLDTEKYDDMCEIITKCEEMEIEPPSEAIDYVERYERGDEKSLKPLRPAIDQGVKIATIDGEKVIEIDLSAIDSEIDIIRVKHEEFEE